MGGHPYWYFVAYKSDLNLALQELREREFEAGRYNPVVAFLDFPIDPELPSPGAQHHSIADAMEAADADGTRSILDIESIGDAPDSGVAAPLPEKESERWFGTTRPTHRMIEENMDFLENVDRGNCVYMIVYKDGRPDEIFFAGYSYD